MTKSATTLDAGPCPHCPWREANQGKPHPDSWYTKTNLRRLWAGLRRGEDMSCHPTDPGNPVSDAAAAKGYKPAPAHAEMRECAGALILKQREFMRLQDDYGSDITHYLRNRTRGLTKVGILAMLERAMFGGTAIGGRKMPTPELNELAVQYEPLGRWEARA